MKRVMVVAVFQVVVMFGWAAQNEYVRATAPTFRIPLEPRDPYDLLRGRYFVMNPKDARMVAGAPDVLLTAEAVKAFLGQRSSFDGPAFVGFCPQGEVFRVCVLADRVPADASAQYWSRARLSIWTESHGGKDAPKAGHGITIDLGLDRFFLPNRVTLPGNENEPGWEVEVCHRPGLAPLPRRLFFKGRPVPMS